MEPNKSIKSHWIEKPKPLIGTALLEVGYVWAPYIVYEPETIIYDHNDFIPSRDIMSRYSIAFTGTGQYYSTIHI